MLGAGIQAGPAGGTMAMDKGRPQIQFSGKSGVSYFEQLMMKRHRYDPMCLSRAATHAHTTSRDREDISPESNNDRDLPIDKGTLSNYNIFYDPEPAESRSPHHETEECISTTPPSASVSSGVEIVELNVGQPIIGSARPDDVKIHPVELKETSAKPVAKTKSSKPRENTRTHPKSTNKKRIQSSRSKPKSKPRSSASSHYPSPKVPSEVTESDIQASVKKAWTNCSEQTQLTQFFLHGVEVADSKVDSEAKSQRAETDYQKCTVSKLSSTIWLPGNSVCSMNANLESLEINPATDLPPVMSGPKSQNQSPPLASANNANSPTCSESDNEDLAELELSVNNVEEGEIWAERQERDEEDEEALESLAWELASTVECEGRLTRCQSEMDKLDSEIGGASSPATPQQEQELEEEEAFVLSDLSKVMSEFELYQQSIMEQDSD